MRSIRYPLLAGAVLMTSLSCQAQNPANPPAPAPAAAQASAAIEIPTTGVRTITLPTFDVAMPAGPGQATFQSACILCHSPRYVLMQPAFPKKTWMAEVDKMKKVYGAPILDEQIEPLVKYLVAIRGNGK